MFCLKNCKISVIEFYYNFFKNSLYNITNILGIIKVPAQNQQLYYKEEILDESKTLSDCGLSSVVARAQSPAAIGLALRYV